MNLLRNFATVGGATMVSRLLGFIRDVAIAASLGAGPIADAFFVAFKLPNLFRRLFAEGAFNSAFVPLFARALEEKGEEGARKFAEEILAAFLTTLILVSIVAEIAMPALVFVLAPGFADDADKFATTVTFSRICFPYLMFVSLVAFLSGILNSLGRFAAAAFAPVLLNVVFIATLIVIGFLDTGQSFLSGTLLSIAVAIAGVVQLVALVLALKPTGMRLTLRRPRVTPGVRRLVKLGVPGVIAGGITQLNIMVGTIIASFSASAVSYLYYADRVYQLPLGVVGVAIGVVLLPDLARQLRSGDHSNVFHTQNRALEFALVLTLPAAVALIVIAGPIVQVLFQRGAFLASDTAATAPALAAFGAGLPAFVLIKVLSPGFFAREDTATPMWFAGAGMVVNVAGSLILFPFLAHIGIAIATSLAGWVNALLLGVTLWRRGHYKADHLLVRRLPLTLLCSVAMGAVVYGAAELLSPWLTDASLAVRAATLGLVVVIGAAAFFVLATATSAVDARRYYAMLKRRKVPAED
ncbi:putative peptidoglycan lipid II flippase [Rhodobium orientis]|uniref:Probable lipid II flippase MurJ n=1 Tax=Rhodobium orientis TaxID=34017 RepID=A0A327JTM8_9HYPH|nr:murein biosynthesis integral membrane protein MurJ [Rhodobium orientis]MBB4304301.1 putative peptidoglycan lipid II flippase [Rhodobium orientis]MBK5948205.1 murein biosynthesis integral membrane protein MurJ [Rhodobium orientis]RAI28803.1 murein biosynthesis integral membrane protein MurJ [Rhodobium orientis]